MFKTNVYEVRGTIATEDIRNNIPQTLWSKTKTASARSPLPGSSFSPHLPRHHLRALALTFSQLDLLSVEPLLNRLIRRIPFRLGLHKPHINPILPPRILPVIMHRRPSQVPFIPAGALERPTAVQHTPIVPDDHIRLVQPRDRRRVRRTTDVREQIADERLGFVFRQGLDVV